MHYLVGGQKQWLCAQIGLVSRLGEKDVVYYIRWYDGADI